MGKPSFKSRNSSQMRKKKRQIRFTKQREEEIKQKEKEIADLQTQMIDIKKFMEGAGERVIVELNKCSRENKNLVNWLKIYDEQIKSYKKEIYNLNLRLYFSSSSSQQSSQPQPQSQLQPQPQPLSQPQPQQSPTYKSMDDYFRSQK